MFISRRSTSGRSFRKIALVATFIALAHTQAKGGKDCPPPHPGGEGPPAGKVESFRVNLPEFNLGGVVFGSEEWILHTDIWITEIRTHLEFQSGPSNFPAQNISAQIFPNVPACPETPVWDNGAPAWNVTGEALGWSGTGTFVADVSTTAFNGWALVAHCHMPALNFWGFQITDWPDHQAGNPEQIGGRFVNSYFEVFHIPLVIDYTCAQDLLVKELGFDCVVNVDDLLTLINNWGTDGEGAAIAAPSSVVNVDDLLGLINAWGPCPAQVPGS